jgi:predicted nuclease of predicted toxin-antitoxin system
MRFLVDECTGPGVTEWLRKQNHEVFSVFEESRGINDEDIIQKAASENWILITNDKSIIRRYSFSLGCGDNINICISGT